MIGLVIAGMQGHMIICFLWWGATMLLLAAYTSCCIHEERDDELRKQQKDQLRTKNRQDIYKIQELHAKEQLIRDYDKIKL